MAKGKGFRGATLSPFVSTKGRKKGKINHNESHTDYHHDIEPRNDHDYIHGRTIEMIERSHRGGVTTANNVWFDEVSLLDDVMSKIGSYTTAMNPMNIMAINEKLVKEEIEKEIGAKIHYVKASMSELESNITVVAAVSVMGERTVARLRFDRMHLIESSLDKIHADIIKNLSIDLLTQLHEEYGDTLIELQATLTNVRWDRDPLDDIRTMAMSDMSKAVSRIEWDAAYDRRVLGSFAGA